MDNPDDGEALSPRRCDGEALSPQGCDGEALSPQGYSDGTLSPQRYSDETSPLSIMSSDHAKIEDLASRTTDASDPDDDGY